MRKKENGNVSGATKKFGRFLRLVRPVLLLLTTVMLFTYVSFAWLRREWTPFVEQSNITIATGGSLVFEFEGDSGVSTGKSINEILELEKDFVLKPVSSYSGEEKTFFTMDLQKGEGHETYKFLDVSQYNDDGTAMGIENGYIEFQMMLYAPDADGTIRYVYIHPESHIKLSENVDGNPVDAEKCIRMSVTLNSTGETWVFGADSVTSHTGVNPEYDDIAKKYIMDGAPYYKSFDPNDKKSSEVLETYEGKDVVINSNNFKKISDFDGGNYDEDGNLISRNTDEILFTLVSDSNNKNKQWITVRIWAEGTDEMCTDQISGAQIDIKLKFSSFTQTTTA